LLTIAIPQDDRIDDIATLHAALCDEFEFTRTIQQVIAALAHHQTAAPATGCFMGRSELDFPVPGML
jgi:hypothetical protein